MSQSSAVIESSTQKKKSPRFLVQLDLTLKMMQHCFQFATTPLFYIRNVPCIRSMEIYF